MVDTIHDVVDADVTINGKFAGDLGVFNIGSGGQLTLTSTAASALNSTFGLGTTLSSKTVVGTAAPDPFALTHTEAAAFAGLAHIA